MICCYEAAQQHYFSCEGRKEPRPARIGLARHEENELIAAAIEEIQSHYQPHSSFEEFRNSQRLRSNRSDGLGLPLPNVTVLDGVRCQKCGQVGTMDAVAGAAIHVQGRVCDGRKGCNDKNRVS